MKTISFHITQLQILYSRKYVLQRTHNEIHAPHMKRFSDSWMWKTLESASWQNDPNYLRYISVDVFTRRFFSSLKTLKLFIILNRTSMLKLIQVSINPNDQIKNFKTQFYCFVHAKCYQLILKPSAHCSENLTIPTGTGNALTVSVMVRPYYTHGDFSPCKILSHTYAQVSFMTTWKGDTTPFAVEKTKTQWKLSRSESGIAHQSLLQAALPG